MASLLQGVELINAKGEKTQASQLAGKAIGFYFSAHWCPPCRGFTPILAETYTNANNSNFEIVFVTSDQDEESFKQYLNEMPWLAIQFGDPKIQELKQKYAIRGIPSLVIVDKDGETITANGRADISSEQEEAIAKWANK
jgi:nucleoredoxin